MLFGPGVGIVMTTHKHGHTEGKLRYQGWITFVKLVILEVVMVGSNFGSKYY